MNWEMVGAVGQAVGALAVVISLVYVARQVRSATRESQHQTGLRVSFEISRWAELLATDGEMAQIFLKGSQGLEPLEPVEKVRFFAATGILFTALETAFQELRSGNWPEWSNQDVTTLVAWWTAVPGIQEWWPERRHFFSPAFAEHVDRAISEQQKVNSPHIWEQHRDQGTSGSEGGSVAT
jgi:hypothetical protein